MAYDKETLIGWRAIKAVGLVARSLAAHDHQFLRETCRKLLWSLSDESGGIGWSAPEMLGEIVSADPHRFADIVPLIAHVYDIEEDVFRAGVLYALFRVAESAPELVVPYQEVIRQSLADRDSLVRVRGIELAGLLCECAKDKKIWGQVHLEHMRPFLNQLKNDKGEAWIYVDNEFTSIQVGEVASKLINRTI
jgi:hypothetical protein